MAINQLMQAHDEFFNGSGGAITYGGYPTGTVIVLDPDGEVLSADHITGSGGPREPSVPINVPPPSFLPLDFDGEHHNDFLYGEAEELVEETNYSGSSGFTIVSYSTSTSRITASLIDPLINTGDAKGDTYGPSVEGLAGTAFDDILYGNNHGNMLLGGAGADQLFGLGGDDRLFGDSGNDTIDGGYGNDVLNGNADNDVLYGRYGNDWLDGGEGNDHLDAGEDDDVVFGNSGDDVIIAWTGNDYLIGGTGIDVLYGGAGADTLDGGADWDAAAYAMATSGVLVDLLNMGRNTGEAQGDVFYRIEAVGGSNHRDELYGTQGRDEFYGHGGDDVLEGRGWGDYLDGGEGFDFAVYWSATSGVRASLLNPSINTNDAQGDVYVSIEGLAGSGYQDVLQGNASANILYGYAGNDELLGGAGADTLDGGDHYDTLVGGDGSDVLTGGAHKDVFQFDWTPGAGNVDTITDFSVAEGDKIMLETGAFRGFPPVVIEETDDGLHYYNHLLKTTQFKIGAAATTADHRIIYDSATGALYYDKDGTGSIAQVQFAQLKAGLALSAASFGLYTL